EMKFVEQYLKLQNLRFKDRLHVLINIPEDYLFIPVPSLVLQSVINYVVQYGIESKAGNATITITGYFSGNDFVLEVANNRIGLSNEEVMGISNENSNQVQEGKPTGITLHYINSILVSSYGKDYKLAIKQNMEGGTTIKIRIPKDWRERPHRV
ncbi:MAG TPA: ATP-binding protein, partial [Chondromyces sp.]|nr:ATP-binding protein [Chondromyces sp.]